MTNVKKDPDPDSHHHNYQGYQPSDRESITKSQQVGALNARWNNVDFCMIRGRLKR